MYTTSSCPTPSCEPAGNTRDGLKNHDATIVVHHNPIKVKSKSPTFLPTRFLTAESAKRLADCPKMTEDTHPIESEKHYLVAPFGDRMKSSQTLFSCHYNQRASEVSHMSHDDAHHSIDASEEFGRLV